MTEKPNTQERNDQFVWVNSKDNLTDANEVSINFEPLSESQDLAQNIDNIDNHQAIFQKRSASRYAGVFALDSNTTPTTSGSYSEANIQLVEENLETKQRLRSFGQQEDHASYFSSKSFFSENNTRKSSGSFNNEGLPFLDTNGNGHTRHSFSNPNPFNFKEDHLSHSFGSGFDLNDTFEKLSIDHFDPQRSAHSVEELNGGLPLLNSPPRKNSNSSKGSTGSGKQQQNQSSNLYKTELCKSFVETGICRYGSKCQFAHGVDELRDVSRGPKYKTKICKKFHTHGYCNYGTRCTYIHISPHDDEKERTKNLLANGFSLESPTTSPSGSFNSALSGGQNYQYVQGNPMFHRTSFSSHNSGNLSNSTPNIITGHSSYVPPSNPSNNNVTYPPSLPYSQGFIQQPNMNQLPNFSQNSYIPPTSPSFPHKKTPSSPLFPPKGRSDDLYTLVTDILEEARNPNESGK